MPTYDRVKKDVWYCDVCDKEHFFKEDALECENNHITNLALIKKQCNSANRICQNCNLGYPTTEYEKSNSIWCKLSRLIKKTEELIEKRKGE